MNISYLIFLSSLAVGVFSAGLKEEFTWTFINYVWPENSTDCPTKIGTGNKPNKPGSNNDFVFPSYSYSNAPKRGYFNFKNRIGEIEESPEYVLENNIPMGATRYKNRLFLTTPRRRVGIPATLSYVDLDCHVRHNVPWRPYPSWDMNSLATQRPADPTDVNTPLVSVYRTTADQCGRLWLVDMGTLEYPTGRQQIQQFAIVVIDLKTNRVLRRFPLPASMAPPSSTLASVTVDVSNNACDDAYAYLPELVNYKMIVYSWKQNDAWIIAHNFFFLDPLQGDFNIGGHQFMWNDGIFSIALGKVASDGYRTAYFHPMVSTKEFAVSTRILKSRDLATRSYHNNDFVVVGERGRNGQSSTHELHVPSNIIFMGEVSKNGLFCWNINRPLTPENQGSIHQDPQKMIYPSDVKLDQEGNVWMMTNSMPNFLYGSLNYDEVNFRVWMNSVKDAVAGTICDRR